MSWIGRVVGFTGGAFAGGPVGAAAGGALGYALDRWLSGNESAESTRSENSNSEDDSEMILRGCFLAQFSAKTGRFGAVERRMIVELAQEDYRGPLSPEVVWHRLDEWSVNDELCRSAFAIASRAPKWRNLLLHSACRVVSKQRPMGEHEAAWLTEACREMGCPTNEVNSVLVWYYRGPEDDGEITAARKLLGVSHGASKDELQRRYRESSVAYHPDRHMTVDRQLRELAAGRFRQISAAYSLLLEYDDSYFGLSDNGSRLKRAEEQTVIRCFGCRQRCRLPVRDHFASVRCPKCQRLLLFREELARRFCT